MDNNVNEITNVNAQPDEKKTCNFFVTFDASTPLEAFKALQDAAIQNDGTDKNLEAILQCEFGKKLLSFETFSNETLDEARNFANALEVDKENVAYCIDMGVSAYFKVYPRDINAKRNTYDYRYYFICNKDGVPYLPLKKYGFFDTITKADKVVRKEFINKGNYNVVIMDLATSIPKSYYDTTKKPMKLIKYPTTLQPFVSEQTIKSYEKAYSTPRVKRPKLTQKNIENNVTIEEKRKFAFFGYVAID